MLMLRNPGSKENSKEHLCSQACAPIPIHKELERGVFLGPDVRFHTIGNVLCLMERMLDWELSDLVNSLEFSLILGQVT